MTRDLEILRRCYSIYKDRIKTVRNLTRTPLTFAEKILYSHLERMPDKPFVRGFDYADFNPDRVAMQDATAQMALLQFMHAGMERTAVPATVHCDHLITAECGEEEDLPASFKENKEVYDFLSSVCLKYGIDCWKPGAGIIHQLVLENYAFPGGLIIGTDSHTPNAGGAAMLGIGVGGSDAVDVMAGLTWELKWPKLFGIKLTGKLSGWASAKDIILKVLGLLTVKGGTGYIIEYFGEGAQTLSATGKATICNMGAELGATSSIFPYDNKIKDYLTATGRNEAAGSAESIKDLLSADPEVVNEPEKYFDRVIEINLSLMKAVINGPFTPDLSYPLSGMKEVVKEKGYPDSLSACLVGSCTNSSYEDMERAAGIARQALDHGIKPKTRLYLSPGSEKVKSTMEKEGLLDIFKKLGTVLLSNACGPCIGMWKRNDIAMGEQNTIVSSFNRNFAKRADGNPNTFAFVASPETVMALSLGGSLSFNPETDELTGSKGERIKLSPPSGREIPERFYDNPDNGIIEKKPGRVPGIIISEKSERLALLERFEKWDGGDIINAPVLIKIKGKCTTDHISMAGPWLKYRGHLDKISNNLFLGAVNAYTGETGLTKNGLSGDVKPVPETARDFKNKGIGWVVIGDENYGEGSSREHAAMEVRYLNGKAVIVRSFARIHETNLKKQGVLALIFKDPSDYEKIMEGDSVDITDLSGFSPGKPLKMIVHHMNGTIEDIRLNHTYNEMQIAWFKAGSALNLIAGRH